MREATYKLARQTGRAAHFASVSVLFAPSEEDAVELRCPESDVRGWADAIVAGAAEANADLKSRQLFAGGRVVVTKFVGLTVDTTDEDARFATRVAVLRAATGRDDIEVGFAGPSGDERHVRWGASPTG